MAIRKSKFGRFTGGPRGPVAPPSDFDIDAGDAKMGFARYEQGAPRVGWMINFQETSVNVTPENPSGNAAVDLYFLDDEGDYFKATLPFSPYFLVKCKPDTSTAVEEYLRTEHGELLKNVEHQEREDLTQVNHLIGARQPVLKLSFHNNKDFMAVRRAIKRIVEDNTKVSKFAYVDTSNEVSTIHASNAKQYILDVNEEDVPYTVRVFIDNDIRAGKWYKVSALEGNITLEEQTDMVARPDPVVMAFDIEAAKEPLMFPDPENDQITMISYMVDGRGYLITNRTYVSKDIEAFEFTPKPEYVGEFEIFNEPTEKDMLIRFFEQIREERPTVMVSFNGDFFDWPYIEKRALVNDMNLRDEIGFYNVGEDTYSSSYCCHLDAFAWVKRDSYLPQGSQSLKEVTKVKLGYNPHELDPEDMTPFALEKPQKLAEYSVSDAVATYYLYMKYVHPFIFSLCMILPLKPDDVLRKGTGTLCEMLLMVQAYQKNILLPHKHSDSTKKFHNGHLIESETYSGGHVECLEPGVFRNDICYDFKLDPATVQRLIDELGPALKYTIENDAHTPFDAIENFDEVKQQIENSLIELRDNPVRNETPYIYHLDVASMYPNIMTTNRLQPDSVVTEEDCEKCHFHRRDKTCARRLDWKWRGEYYNAKPSEYRMIEQKIREQRYPLGDMTFGKGQKEKRMVTYDELPVDRQHAIFRERVKEYSKTAHSKSKTTEETEIEAIICQRENPFYVNTVRDFKDRRINFKSLQKSWKKKVEAAETKELKEDAKKMVVLYDSMQLAHKVILNSFYGYVKRTGSRWYSIEMAGVTCYTGAKIIQEASELVKGLGRPLELDTDGIWCIIPGTFPADVSFKLKKGGKLKIEYPGVILNYMVWCGYTNKQYQTLKEGSNGFEYDVTVENSIFFEVDGPYKAMILPTSLEEGVNIKKRYAVFELDGSLSELKGFELKRRGELEIVKKLQGGLFAEFLKGSSLEDSYGAAARRADSWLSILENKGQDREDSDILGLISEEKSMSKAIVEYGAQKSTTITAALRIAEFLGSKMVERKGLNARYIIAKYPRNAPVTERAIPVAIFNAPEATKTMFLKKWLVSVPQENFDLRNIIDWDYYRKRLQVVIQKIITVPAALQNLSNPLPRVEHPPWLEAMLRERNSTKKQQKVTGFFTVTNKATHMEEQTKLIADIEDTMASGNGIPAPKRGAAVTKRKISSVLQEAQEQEAIDMTKAPSPMEDYSAWLKFQKRVWEQKRLQRLTRHKLFGEKASLRNSSGIKSMMLASAERAFSSGTWQILQLGSSSVPGQVRASIWVNGRIQTVKVNVPRKLFVNYNSDPSSIIATLPKEIVALPANFTLPGGGTSPHLYQVTMPEWCYQRESANAFSVFRNDLVSNVYESQIMPHERAMLELGSVCDLDNSRPGILGKGLESGFDLEWLTPIQSKPETPLNYLKNVNIEYIHLQHYEINNQFFIALFPSWTDKAELIHYATANQPTESLRLSSAYEEGVNLLSDPATEQPYFAYPQQMEFNVHSVHDSRTFYSRVGSLLDELYSERATKTVIAVESARSERLYKLVRPLGELPSIQLTPASHAMPSVGWQSRLAKNIVKSFLRLQHHLHGLLNLANFTNVPIGNMSNGDTRQLIDIMYARRLSEQRNVLWWSSTPLPDYGGKEDDYSELLEEDVTPPLINNSGLYAEVCVDMDVSNFAVNTILSSNIQSIVDGVTNQADDDAGVPFLRDAFSTSALMSLSALVREWWGLVRKDSQEADMLIQHLYAWISSPSSMLYDRRLYYHVENLSKGIFMQLVAVIQRLGYNIVMASRNRLVLGTNKSFFANAFSAGKAIIEGIKQYAPKANENSALFTYLDISLQEHWDYLIWLDETNFSGRVTSSNLGSLDEEVKTEHVSEWQLASYLPSVLREEFQEWVMQFMQVIGERKDLVSSQAADDASKNVEASMSLKPATAEESTSEYFAAGSIEYLNKPLVNRMKQLNRRYLDGVAHREVSREFEFPVLAGSSQVFIDSNTNPILELIKDICAVYGLDKNLQREYLWLRKRLLDVVRVGEFESRAQFVNPSSKLILSHMVCENCSYVTEIDVCQPETDSVFMWRCHACGTEFDRVYIEERLVQKQMQAINHYQTQDLKCSKCGKMRADDLAQFCQCSGSYVATIPTSALRQDLAVYAQVAKYFNLRFLQDAVDATMV